MGLVAGACRTEIAAEKIASTAAILTTAGTLRLMPTPGGLSRFPLRLLTSPVEPFFPASLAQSAEARGAAQFFLKMLQSTVHVCPQ